jgi:archaellum biogenesis ATPase FlaH
LCEHLGYNALSTQSSVAFYSSKTSSPSVVSRMASRRRDVPDHSLLDIVLEHIMALPSEFDFVVVDILTSFLPCCTKSNFLNFLILCRQLCGQGNTIVLSLDCHAALSNITDDLAL